MRHGGGVAIDCVLSGEREVEANSGCRSWCSWHVGKNVDEIIVNNIKWISGWSKRFLWGERLLWLRNFEWLDTQNRQWEWQPMK